MRDVMKRTRCAARNGVLRKWIVAAVIALAVMIPRMLINTPRALAGTEARPSEVVPQARAYVEDANDNLHCLEKSEDMPFSPYEIAGMKQRIFADYTASGVPVSPRLKARIERAVTHAHREAAEAGITNLKELRFLGIPSVKDINMV